jgi:3-hydroxyisobutyrate dehydrogenase
MTSETIGFAGLGLMGSRMAARLLDEGRDLIVWNRTRGKAAELVAAGAKESSSPAELGANSAIVISMVADDAALDAVYRGPDGIFQGMASGGLIIEMSTTSMSATRALGQEAADKGIAFLDAPVFGSTDAARAGNLVIVVGADEHDLARARPVLESLGAVNHLGLVGAGTAMKLAGNSIGAGTTALVAEALSFGTAAGLVGSRMLEVMALCGFNSAMLQARGAATLDERFEPGWPVKHVVKDLSLAGRAGAELGVAMRAVEGARADYEAAVEAGFADADAAAVIKGVNR